MRWGNSTNDEDAKRTVVRPAGDDSLRLVVQLLSKLRSIKLLDRLPQSQPPLRQRVMVARPSAVVLQAAASRGHTGGGEVHVPLAQVDTVRREVRITHLKTDQTSNAKVCPSFRRLACAKVGFLPPDVVAGSF